MDTTSRNDGRAVFAWEGDVPDGHSADNPLTITMDADKTVVAVFKCGDTGAVVMPLATVMLSGMVAYLRRRG